MTATVIVIFCVVYVGLILGRVPGLRMGRTGIALLGAVGMLLTGVLTIEQAWQSVDASTMLLLFALMVISASFEQSGMYSLITRKITNTPTNGNTLLLIVILVTGALSAVLANDVVCLATTPVLLKGVIKRQLNPLPFMIGLACAANIGSAATLIGNPQNILIGETLKISFPQYFFIAIFPVAISLLVSWGIIVLLMGRVGWEIQKSLVDTKKLSRSHEKEYSLSPLRAWLTTGILVLLVLLFLFTDFHKPTIALAGAGVLLLSRTRQVEEALEHVDWQLLLLFIALFIINGALAATGELSILVSKLTNLGLDTQSQPVLYILTAALSNLVSNVPAVILILNIIHDPTYGPLLALSSTLAGNFIIVGSIANIIVVTQSERLGYRIDWKSHATFGIPITLITLAFTGGWLWFLHLFSNS